MVLHLATQHQLLKEVMQKDKRPGIAAVLKALYPEEGAQEMVQDMEIISEVTRQLCMRKGETAL